VFSCLCFITKKLTVFSCLCFITKKLTVFSCLCFLTKWWECLHMTNIRDNTHTEANHFYVVKAKLQIMMIIINDDLSGIPSIKTRGSHLLTVYWHLHIKFQNHCQCPWIRQRPPLLSTATDSPSYYRTKGTLNYLRIRFII
jgi:hypothetical protein